MEKNKKVQLIAIVIEILILLLIVLMGTILRESIIISVSVWFFGLVILLASYYLFDRNRIDSTTEITDALGSNISSALDFGDLGVITYDKNYIITWMSDLFVRAEINRVGKKLLMWLPECNELIQGESDEVLIEIDNKTYLVRRKEDEPILFFKDVTESNVLKRSYDDEQLVVGYVHLDNYDETTQYEDEQERTYINNYIRQPVIDWFSNRGIIIKSLRTNRFYVVMTERKLQELVNDRFGIMDITRKASRQIDVAVTLSMSFAHGSQNLKELDEACNNLLELAQSRGGDQVAMRKIGEDIKFFGGATEAQEKRSKVRVRIMAHTLRDMIIKSSNIIICGHREMDADCIGAALCVGNIVKAYHKPVSIIAKTGGVDPMIADVLRLFEKELVEKHNFISESEALNQLQKNTLVIMVDHHDLDISNGKNVLKEANKIAIIDHHRRKADLAINPSLIYVETSASSTTELTNELVPYLSKEIEYNSEEANVMYMGLIIDTNNFIIRTGARTFNVASYLRQNGADPILCDKLMREPYDYFIKRNEIVNHAKEYDNQIIISCVDNNTTYSRTLLSQAANQLLSIKNIEAVFVIAKIDNNTVAISSRSFGNINVQIIMEAMHGGGHLTQAAVQRSDISVAELYEELIVKIKEYEEREMSNESNNA